MSAIKITLFTPMAKALEVQGNPTFIMNGVVSIGENIEAVDRIISQPLK